MLVAVVLSQHTVKATPTNLSPNDVVIVTANSDSGWSTTACTDAVPGGPDSNAIDLLLRKDIGAGTQIKVTDNAWTGSALATTEGVITYTAATDLSAGTVIRYSDCLYLQGGSGWTRSTPIANFDAAVSGDNLLVYQGSEAAPDFIFGFGFRSNSWITTGTTTANNSYLPTVLSDAGAYVTMASPIARNFQYAGAIQGVFADDFLASLQTAGNWSRTGTSGVAGVPFGASPISFDGTRPTFSTVTRQAPLVAATNASSVTFRVTTSEPVQAFGTGDFTVLTTDTATYAAIAVTAVDASTYDVIISGVSGDGTIVLGAFTGVLVDMHGNPAIDTSFVGEAYTIDTTAPATTVDVVTTDDTSPALTGTVDDSTATVVITINGVEYAAKVIGSTWALAAGTIDPALSAGSYDVTITATDTVGNTSVYTGSTAVGGLIITEEDDDSTNNNSGGDQPGDTLDDDDKTTPAMSAPDTGVGAQGVELGFYVGVVGLIVMAALCLLIKRRV